eukprot:jgi/Tetstr1/432026/TSEL_021500.t1
MAAPGTFRNSCRTAALCARCAGRPDTVVPKLCTYCTSCPASAVPAAHFLEWRRLLTGADGLEDLRLRASTADTYRSSLRCLRRKAAAALSCDYCRVSGSGAVPCAELSAVRVLFDAELLGCRYIRVRVDVDKNVDARHECFYIPDHVLCLSIHPVDML